MLLLFLVLMQSSKIGLFLDNYPPAVDGVSLCVENYAYWLQKKHASVDVVIPHIYGGDYSALDYQVHEYLSFPIPGRAPYVMGVPALDPFIYRGLMHEDFRILHSHSPFSSGTVAANLARKKNIPLVATFHSKYKDDFSRLLPKPLVTFMMGRVLSFFNRADEVWVPQESVKEVIRSYGYKGNVEVVENGSDFVSAYPEEFFSESRRALGVDGNELVLLFVGQHIWEKGTGLIIDALSELEDLPFRMFFVGTGYAAEEMRHKVHDCNLSDKVTFVGTILDRDLIKRYYAAADLFLFPSMYDNAPLVVKEAAALATPTLMLRGSTASAIVRDGQNGFLVEADKHALASRIRELSYDMEQLRTVGKNAASSIVRPWEDCVGEAFDRYNSLLRRKGLSPLE